MTISNERLQDQSVFYWLKSFLPLSVNVVDGFPTNNNAIDPALILPTVSVESQSIKSFPFELGDNQSRHSRMWAIEVFAKTKTQRDELAYSIMNKLDSNIPVYDYNLGFPPIDVPLIGALVTEEIVVKPIHVFRDLVKDMYWRSSVTFFTEYRSF